MLKEIKSKLRDHLLTLADLDFGIDFMDVKSLAIKLAKAVGGAGRMVLKCTFQTYVICRQQHWKETAWVP